MSPHARPRATVSKLNTCSQLETELDPKRFTIRAVPARLDRTNAE
jgi:bifunctional non-homologous end joining protein LigD